MTSEKSTELIIKVIILIALAYLLYKAYRYWIKMDISKKGLDFIKFHEGVRYKMYYDTQGYPTIGVGHLITENEKHLLTEVLSENQVNDLFRKDIKKFVDAANEAFVVPVKQHEFDATVSFLFNVGRGWAGFGGHEVASFIKYRNSIGDYDKKRMISLIMRFRNPPEIQGRRAKEARLFTEGNYSDTMSKEEIRSYLNL
jgi:lysozyme